MTIKQPNRFALNGAQLKMIAMVTMLIDHMAVVLIERPYPYVTDWLTWDGLTILNLAMRLMGRLSFPIFAFLIVVGFYKTGHVQKYALRLGLFALLSEVPFDYALMGRWDWGYQNIFFTLLIGLLMLYLVHRAKPYWLKGVYFVLACLVAHFLRVDYGWFGIALIGMMALLYTNPRRYLIPTAILLLYQYTASLSAFLVYQYDGKRGRQNKWLMYAFYPVHLALLYMVSRWML